MKHHSLALTLLSSKLRVVPRRGDEGPGRENRGNCVVETNWDLMFWLSTARGPVFILIELIVFWKKPYHGRNRPCMLVSWKETESLKEIDFDRRWAFNAIYNQCAEQTYTIYAHYSYKDSLYLLVNPSFCNGHACRDLSIFKYTYK